MSKILILGGGFGGIKAALDLEKKLGNKSEITLIDKNSYHLFVPSLYEVASAYCEDKDRFAMALKKTVAISYTDIFAGKKINFMQAEVAKISLSNQLVATRGDHILAYDYLVLALGSQVADFGIPGVCEYALQFRLLEDALAINQKVASCLKHAGENNQLPIKILICGAGFTGIELAAELSKYIQKLKSKFKLQNKPALIYMFEAGPQILSAISEKERNLIRNRLKKLGIIIMENSPISEVGEGSVKFKNGHTMTGNLVIWTAGLRANKFLQTVNNLELTPQGKIIISEDLSLPNYKNVFAVGDNIEFMDHRTQKPIPALAYLAVDHGAIAAKNIYNSINNKSLQMHKPFYDVWVAPVGGRYAVAHIHYLNITLKGILGWMVHELISLRYFISILPINKAFKLFLRDIKVFSKND